MLHVRLYIFSLVFLCFLKGISAFAETCATAKSSTLVKIPECVMEGERSACCRFPTVEKMCEEIGLFSSPIIYYKSMRTYQSYSTAAIYRSSDCAACSPDGRMMAATEKVRDNEIDAIRHFIFAAQASYFVRDDDGKLVRRITADHEFLDNKLSDGVKHDGNFMDLANNIVGHNFGDELFRSTSGKLTEEQVSEQALKKAISLIKSDRSLLQKGKVEEGAIQNAKDGVLTILNDSGTFCGTKRNQRPKMQKSQPDKLFCGLRIK